MKALALSALLATSLLLFTSCKKDNSVDTGTIPSTLNDSLVAYLPFNGNLLDSTTFKNNGTTKGGVTFTSDRFGTPGKALTFDGTGYVVIAPSKSMDIKGDFSFSVWIKPDTITTDWHGSFLLQRCGDNPVAHNPFTVSYNNWLLHIDMGLFSGSGDISEYQGLSMPDEIRFKGVWTHVVATCNKTTKTMKLYSNGLLVASNVLNNLDINYETADFLTYLGCTHETHSMYKGVMDEPRLYNRELSTEEALQLTLLEN
ncbi:Concanavalin A-like lectin/glucanases superfamily protein [Filimonas lacunae]|uniref:Concanavalin A-like lectin/glucanases superfamily protein n=1 Tax=Filimonas lacunae TaxID=477680 RepID=A0A173MIN6_9BACT|nr:LamG domain-containing protein [Filimonas lacunae]BAV07268.1 streptococcal hemagglutinin protein [Filimonas lacunae]SIS92269.1 Concanavalin A-like lectin/glucanases superfamily protein [Filimonas lacunae]